MTACLLFLLVVEDCCLLLRLLFLCDLQLLLYISNSCGFNWFSTHVIKVNYVELYISSPELVGHYGEL